MPCHRALLFWEGGREGGILLSKFYVAPCSTIRYDIYVVGLREGANFDHAYLKPFMLSYSKPSWVSSMQKNICTHANFKETPTNYI